MGKFVLWGIGHCRSYTDNDNDSTEPNIAGRIQILTMIRLNPDIDLINYDFRLELSKVLKER